MQKKKKNKSRIFAFPFLSTFYSSTNRLKEKLISNSFHTSVFAVSLGFLMVFILLFEEGVSLSRGKKALYIDFEDESR